MSSEWKDGKRTRRIPRQYGMQLIDGRRMLVLSLTPFVSSDSSSIMSEHVLWTFLILCRIILNSPLMRMIQVMSQDFMRKSRNSFTMDGLYCTGAERNSG